MTNDPFLSSATSAVASSLLSSRPVSDGEAVNAANTNRMPQTNYQNAAYLHELLKQVYNRSGEFLIGVPIAEDVVTGDFVYYDGTNRVFAKALARSSILDGRHVESDSSVVWGVVIRVRNEEADLCTGGLCEFQTDLAIYTDNPDPGVRYLSTQAAGEPTLRRNWPEKCLGYLVGVKSGGSIQFFVRLSLTLDQRLHRHQSHELAAVPAGTCEPARPGTILQVRMDKSGWIPADHTVFAGKVPEGACYGYNPTPLQATCRWPLRFAGNAGLRWQRQIAETDDPLLASVPPEFYLIDETTIWWMSETYLPWNNRIAYIDGEPVDEPDAAYRTRLWFDYVNSGYGLSDALVSSLRTAEGSGLRLTQYPFGGAAILGDLLLDLDWTFRQATEMDTSGFAVKKIDKRELTLGPVVSGLKIDSSRWRVIQSEKSQDGYHFGAVVLGDPTGKIGRELPFEAVHLEGVEEAVEREAIGLAFASSRVSSFLARIAVPFDAEFDTFNLSLSFGILVTRSGNVAPDILKLSYRIIENPSAANKITQAFPQNTLRQIDCDFSVTNNQYSNGYYTTESGIIRVKPGDLLLLKIERKPPDNFSDRIILLRKSALLYYI